MSDALARLYPSTQTAQPAEPAPADPPITAAPPDATPQPEAKPAPLFPEAALASFYDLPKTKGFVNWNEGEVGTGALRLETPPGWETTPEAAAERQAVADHMASVGVGPSLARELWNDVAAATARPVTTSREAGMAELTRTWGTQTEAKIEAARSVIAEMEARYPGTIRHLEATGLGNSPDFIRKVATLAARRGRR